MTGTAVRGEVEWRVNPRSGGTDESPDERDPSPPHFPMPESPGGEADDVRIEIPPPRPGGRVEVRLRYTGRSRPLPVEHPDPDGRDE